MELKRSRSNSLEALSLKLKELEGVQAKTGWFPAAKYEDGTPVAYAAALNELGHGNTPARPTMRPTAIAKKEEWSKIAAEGARQIVKGNATAFDVMDSLGLRAEVDVASAIAHLSSPPLSPVTIEIRAMKKKNPDLKITGATVGIAAQRVKQPGYQTPSGVSTKPLNDTGTMFNTLTHITEKTS